MKIGDVYQVKMLLGTAIDLVCVIDISRDKRWFEGQVIDTETERNGSIGNVYDYDVEDIIEQVKETENTELKV